MDSGAEVLPVLQGQEGGVLRAQAALASSGVSIVSARAACYTGREVSCQQRVAENGQRKFPSNLTSCLAFPALDSFPGVNREALGKKKLPQGRRTQVPLISHGRAVLGSVSHLCQFISELVGPEEKIYRRIL